MSMPVYQRIRATGHFIRPNQGSIAVRDVSIELEQLGSGSTFLYCESRHLEGSTVPWEVNSGNFVSFEGNTNDGFPVRTSHLRIHHGHENRRHCFSVTHVTLGDTTASYSEVESVLTNFVFPQHDLQLCPLKILIDNPPLLMNLNPLEKYTKHEFDLRRTGITNVTTTLRMAIESLHMDALDVLIDDVCTALSVVQGRRVQWIQKTAYSRHGERVWSEFGETVTKDHVAGFLCLNPDTRTGIILQTHSVTAVVAMVREFRQKYDPNYGILKAWFDARQEDDFLEARTLKYVIVLEALCNRLESKAVGVSSTHLPPKEWRETGKKFLPLVKNHMVESYAVDPDVIDEVCNISTWGNLNRVGFRKRLTACLRKLNVQIRGQDKRMRRVVEIRNKIVHSSRYLTADELRTLKSPRLDSKEQNFMVAFFVDELLLRLFGLGDSVPDQLVDSFRANV